MRLKRVLAITLALAMSLGMVACGASTDSNEQEIVDEIVLESTDETADATDTEPAEPTEGPVDDVVVDEEAATDDNNTVAFDVAAQQFFFEHTDTFDDSKDWLHQAAYNLVKSTGVPLDIMTMNVEPGLLTGFGNTEITGFEKAVQFGPMIGPIPFVGFIFDLEDDTDVEEFTQILNDNADLRWNICTEAEKVTIVNKDNVVLFMMHPVTFDE